MMYDLVYKAFHNAGIITLLDKEVIYDINGKETADKSTIFSLQTKYKLIHPDYLLFIDEVSSNLHCDHDNNVGREKYIIEHSTDHTIICSKNNDYRFLLLGFTSTSGCPVLCVYIIKAETLSYNQVMGADINIPYVYCGDLLAELQENIGSDKRFPRDLVYYFCGKTIPCIIIYSSSRGINQEIL